MARGQLDEGRFKRWMETHIEEVLRSLGISTGQTVLDFGCGVGAYSLAAARLVGASGRVYALDTKKRLLDALARRAECEGLGQLHTVLAEDSLGTSGLAEGSVDVVLLYDVLQLVEQQEELVRSLGRALKPGGVVSVFPMHVGEKRLLELVATVGGFTLGDRRELLFDFVRDAHGPSPAEGLRPAGG
jgi:ubiquinone/menaquinone biosynthesis C-methylase UbiE